MNFERNLTFTMPLKILMRLGKLLENKQKLLLHCANDFSGFLSTKEQIASVSEEIVTVGNEFGFEEIDSENVRPIRLILKN